LNTIAKLISYLFHPLMVLTYALIIMLAVNPYAFGAQSIGDKRGLLLLISVFTTSFMIPGLGVALMKPLGLIKSLEMHDKQERIGPYIICGVFYLWLFKNFMDGPVPLTFAKFSLGATIALFFAFFFNIFTKISAHATGMGALAGMVLILAFAWPGAALDVWGLQMSLNALFALVVLLAGLVGFCRLQLEAHTLPDVWRGYASGAAAVFLANWIL
jgi:hypothetical protein